jgi:hypothetical protein
VIAGQVYLSDKQRTPCFADRPAFRTYVTASVVLEDAAHNVVAGPVDGNGVGQFVLPAVQVPAGAYEIVATCLKATARIAIGSPAGDSYTDVTIPNAPPSLDRLEAKVGGKAVRLVPPGSTVELHAVAKDPDGNTLTFKWADSNKPVAGALDTISYPVALPSSTTVSVQASDGRGGFAWAMIPVTGGTAGPALIAGTAVDSDIGAAIPGARIIINSKPTATDASGRFSIFVDPAPRYSISANKREYALLSKVTYAPAAELRLPLVHLLPTPFDAGKGGTLVSSERNKNGNSIQLILAPNSLADSSNTPFTGTGKAYLWGYPKGSPIPGDMTGTFQGKQSQLETQGAAYIELTDATDQPLRLRSLAQATLTIKPTGAAPPPTIPLFIFEDDTGIWREHGTLKLTATGVYSGTITHLSAFNADLAFGTTGCIEYHVDANRSPAFPFYLHLEQGGQAANHEPFQVADFEGVVSRLHPGTPVDWFALPTPTSPVTEAIGRGTVNASTFVNNTGNPDNDYQPVGSGNCTIFTILADFPPNETWLTGLPGSPGSAAPAPPAMAQTARRRRAPPRGSSAAAARRRRGRRTPPCVATIRSSPCTVRSWMLVTGRSGCSGCQWSPASWSVSTRGSFERLLRKSSTESSMSSEVSSTEPVSSPSPCTTWAVLRYHRQRVTLPWAMRCLAIGALPVRRTRWYLAKVSLSFNTTGPCIPGEHYMLPPERRLEPVLQLIEERKYFTLHAGRQIGKTTSLMWLERHLNDTGRWRALWADLEKLADHVAAQLVHCFGSDAPAPLSITIEDWAADPWVAVAADLAGDGSHPEVRPGVLRQAHLDGRVWFAAAETAELSPGLIEGAMAAGERAGAAAARTFGDRR